MTGFLLPPRRAAAAAAAISAPDGKLPGHMLGVTPQEQDLVGPLIGTTTGPDDKERPKTGGSSSQNTANPNGDLCRELPNFGVGGGECPFGLGELLNQLLGINPEIPWQEQSQ